MNVNVEYWRLLILSRIRSRQILKQIRTMFPHVTIALFVIINFLTLFLARFVGRISSFALCILIRVP